MQAAPRELLYRPLMRSPARSRPAGLLCCAPDFLEHTRAPVREAVLLAVEVEVPHAGRP